MYVDKTDLVWQMADYATFIFLSRPRRFGKSLLSSTLHSYFAGERELFEGLKIMELEQEWKQYPVLLVLRGSDACMLRNAHLSGSHRQCVPQDRGQHFQRGCLSEC